MVYRGWILTLTVLFILLPPSDELLLYYNTLPGGLMRRVKAFIISYLILMGLWLILTGFYYDELIVGSVTAILVSLVFSNKLVILGDFRINPKSLYCSVRYIFVFLIELIKSSIDVAGRVLSPTLPINPGIVKVRTKLKSGIGRTILANSITLTPGTMTVEIRDEFLYIHWIDIKTDDIDTATEAIVSKFERHLEVIFG
jgi:multicomponent Na+:H+ antiporter subunit E